DEIQTGFYRLGEKFYYMAYAITPDILCVGKALTSSLPLSALLLGDEAASFLDPQIDSSTHIANPLAVAAALACLRIYRSGSFLSSLRQSERSFGLEMDKLRERVISEIDVRSYRGVFGGLVFDHDSISFQKVKSFVNGCIGNGVFLAQPIGKRGNIVKFVPPLTSLPAHIERGFQVIDASLKACNCLRSGVSPSPFGLRAAQRRMSTSVRK
ncbi:MAG: aminotransferase class III-fold pyridoxal phosphate-dependent enzyme, partial [Nitrososphaera sp.]|nr:aminotransferase class III-fold pyridoxal phosphate-dependent enzyme [Nitrososphaera sp.]